MLVASIVLVAGPAGPAGSAASTEETREPGETVCTDIGFDPDWWLVPDHPCSPVDPVRSSLGGADLTLLPQSSFGSHDDLLHLTDHRELFTVGSSAVGIR